MCPRNDLDGDVEGLGLVYFEAHGLGLPCVGSRSGGVPEAIGDAGLIVEEPAAPAAVAAVLTEALRPDRHQMLCEAVERRQHSHSWVRFLDDWERRYTDLAGGRPV
jgi:phosphatidylinositol alpha-1,6-mannosyltransferase